MTDEDTMKQIAQNYKSGELIVLDAPVPACRPGGVLVDQRGDRFVDELATRAVVSRA